MKIDKKVIVPMIMIIIILITTVVNAINESKFTAQITSNKDEVKQEEEIIVTLSVSDIDMGENGMNAIEGTIDYDRNVFEEIKSENIKGLNNWNITYNDEDGDRKGKFLTINLSQGIKEDSQVFSVTLKAKSNINEISETTINFKDITSNDGENLVNIGSQNVKIKINSIGTSNIANEKEEKTEEKQNNVVKTVVITASTIATVLVVIFGIKRLK